MTFELPRHVDVLGVRYSVSEDSVEPGEDGYCSPARCRIGVRPGLPLDKRRQVFLHELVHAILDQLACEDEYADERLVQGLAIGLDQALASITSSS